MFLLFNIQKTFIINKSLKEMTDQLEKVVSSSVTESQFGIKGQSLSVRPPEFIFFMTLPVFRPLVRPLITTRLTARLFDEGGTTKLVAKTGADPVYLLVLTAGAFIIISILVGMEYDYQKQFVIGFISLFFLLFCIDRWARNTILSTFEKYIL